MCKSKIYSAGADTLAAVRGYLNGSSRSMAESISRDADLNAKAEAKAKENYEQVCREVWRDKNALKELKNYKGANARDMKIEFNRYRSRVRQSTAEKVLDGIARETGKRRQDLYISSATSNVSADELSGLTVPEDWDVTVTEVNFSGAKRANSFAIEDPTVPKNVQAASKENIYLVIDQELAQNALARNLHKEVYGFEAATIEQAKAAMKKLDVTGEREVLSGAPDGSIGVTVNGGANIEWIFLSA